MIKIAKKVLSGWRDTNATLDEKVEYILDNFPIKEIARSLVELLEQEKAEQIKPEPVDKIVITEQQYKTYFRIKGLNEDGTPSKRGRKPKTNE